MATWRDFIKKADVKIYDPTKPGLTGLHMHSYGNSVPNNIIAGYNNGKVTNVGIAERPNYRNPYKTMGHVGKMLARDVKNGVKYVFTDPNFGYKSSNFLRGMAKDIVGLPAYLLGSIAGLGTGLRNVSTGGDFKDGFNAGFGKIYDPYYKGIYNIVNTKIPFINKGFVDAYDESQAELLERAVDNVYNKSFDDRVRAINKRRKFYRDVLHMDDKEMDIAFGKEIYEAQRRSIADAQNHLDRLYNSGIRSRAWGSLAGMLASGGVFKGLGGVAKYTQKAPKLLQRISDIALLKAPTAGAYYAMGRDIYDENEDIKMQKRLLELMEDPETRDFVFSNIGKYQN